MADVEWFGDVRGGEVDGDHLSVSFVGLTEVLTVQSLLQGVLKVLLRIDEHIHIGVDLFYLLKQRIVLDPLCDILGDQRRCLAQHLGQAETGECVVSIGFVLRYFYDLLDLFGSQICDVGTQNLSNLLLVINHVCLSPFLL